MAFQSGGSNYTFDIPMTACGSRAIAEDGRMGFENTIIIQAEEVSENTIIQAEEVSENTII